MVYTPKQRMLNAYKGVFSDRYPVAPEFWYLYPAELLGVSMIEFEREIPFWRSLQEVFTHHKSEGWGAAFPKVNNPDLEKEVSLKKIGETRYLETTTMRFKSTASGKTEKFKKSKIYDEIEPSWVKDYPVKEAADIEPAVAMELSDRNEFDFSQVNRAHEQVGEDYLLEMWMGVPFFDFLAELMGFEKAVLFFTAEEEERLERIRNAYIKYQKRFIREVCEHTAYESFVIGCSYSCNSLIGPNMWRQWDKPYIKAMADEIHAQGKLLHIHFHGRSMNTVSDFTEIGIDCVCPFERGPGGDVDSFAGLQEVRRQLQDKVTMNGNVHTVETLIRGVPKDVIREVQEIKEAFKGSPRLIIGTGDQVGRETPIENIEAMIEEAKKS